MTSLVQAGQRVTASMLNGLPVTLSPLAAGSVSNSTAETVIGQWVIPAGDGATGQGYSFRVIGSADFTTGTPTLRLKLRLTNAAGTLLMQGAQLTCRSATLTNQPWEMHGELYLDPAGSSGGLDGYTNWTEALQSATPAAQASMCIGTAVDTTAAITLAITAIWGTASASNTARTLSGGLGRTP